MADQWGVGPTHFWNQKKGGNSWFRDLAIQVKGISQMLQKHSKEDVNRFEVIMPKWHLHLDIVKAYPGVIPMGVVGMYFRKRPLIITITIVWYNLEIALNHCSTQLPPIKHTIFTFDSRILINLLSHSSHDLGSIQSQSVIYRPPWSNTPLTRSPWWCIIYLNIYRTYLIRNQGYRGFSMRSSHLLIHVSSLFWMSLMYLGSFIFFLFKNGVACSCTSTHSSIQIPSSLLSMGYSHLCETTPKNHNGQLNSK